MTKPKKVRVKKLDTYKSLYELRNLYEESGGNPNKCEFCGKSLNSKKSWTRGLDGAGAHLICIEDN